ncbi:molybdopterin-guanine dinucleotide biosynthesis protein A [Denitrobaculum tricleocarpae]|uniref:Molybdopterin-guanine dinucleotide biosynthesis protein A n=1 Tax=Denitrobaculum tricleocarpae TaxID=2591009 RepID=A0A545TP74_9PROT|nr:molybdopterin-guanine dinucleotide biosynthesis protein A [Denitrobaculum tricleocarpae]TQV78971.1 molybdopterin-guanine dinucleotide biosynthesis protein A [Denitrobaculum tricleocarpae]
MTRVFPAAELRVLALGAVMLVFSAVAGGNGLRADDRHAGYYYPEPMEVEIYEARAQKLAGVGRSQRIGFVTGITNEKLKSPYPPEAAIFAKGEQAEKLIIVALQDERIDTLFRARAIFANLTASARVLPIFKEFGVQDWFTFFDLAKMLGFEQITISNGREFSHQVIIK